MKHRGKREILQKRNIGELWDNFKWSNICVNEVSNQSGRQKKKSEEIMAENLPNLMKTL